MRSEYMPKVVSVSAFTLGVHIGVGAYFASVQTSEADNLYSNVYLGNQADYECGEQCDRSHSTGHRQRRFGGDCAFYFLVCDFIVARVGICKNDAKTINL